MRGPAQSDVWSGAIYGVAETQVRREGRRGSSAPVFLSAIARFTVAVGCRLGNDAINSCRGTDPCTRCTLCWMRERGTSERPDGSACAPDSDRHAPDLPDGP
jgi:hypothetical protein